MALTAATISFLAFIVTYLNQCSLYDRGSYRTQCDLNVNRTYDFIIVGGGSAGTTLASRLSENPRWKVLLIEAGDVPSELSEAPAVFFALQGTNEADWQFKTERGNHCLGLTNQRCNWPQGKALGGGSTINFMLAIKGYERDYKQWADLGNTEWSWDNVKPYFGKAFEQMQTTSYQSAMPTRKMVLDAAASLGFAVNNPNVNIGYEDVHVTINSNQRHNTAKAYIVSANKRSNLCVMTNTVVSRVIFIQKHRCMPKAIGVQLQNGKKIYAQKEVIVSAGAVSSPKLLMLSGIGPNKTILAHQNSVVKHLPGVGRNLQDHLMFPAFFLKFPKMPLEANFSALLEEYCQTKQGPVGQIDIAEVVGWINTRNDSLDPDVQFMHLTMLKNNSFLTPAYVQKIGFNEESADSILAVNAENTMITFFPILLKPKSRGQILLASNIVKDAPIIHPGYLTDEHDLETMMHAIKHLNRLVGTEAFSEAEVVDIKIPNCKQFEFNTDDYWACSVRNFATTLYHPAGTCKMGNDTMAVVDEYLKVHGVQNLRVVDASIMPVITTGNTNLAVISIAEKAADIIKSCY